jgi:hypothetical protein
MQKIDRVDANITAALLKIDGFNLILPQGEIRTLESSTDVDTHSPVLKSTGWVDYANKRWPVYCLTEELILLENIPPQRSVCALLGMGAGYIGIMCDDMTVLKDVAAQRYELPVAMRLPGSPILYLVNYEQGIACVSNARQITAYVERLVLNA